MSKKIWFPIIPTGGHKVFVRCTTFNQSKYIEEALNGFAMQQTVFPFVCMVIDDASTDGEQETIKNWITCYCEMSKAESIDIDLASIILVPHKTNPNCSYAFYFLKRNLYKEPYLKQSLYKPWREHCKYEALCEGDDYWTDPLKLQKQVDYLENHPECSCCVTDYQEYYQNAEEFKNPNLACIKDFEGNGLKLDINYYSKCVFFTKTLTAMFRIDAYANSKISQYAVSFDMMMFYALATQGYIYIMNEKTGVYRINDGSMVSSANVDKFNRTVIPKLFSICEAENTQHARDFIYNYMKSHVYWMLKDNWRYIFKYYKHLGSWNATKIITKDLCIILFDIIMYRLKLK